MQFDTIVWGGTVVDGTGAPAKKADLAVIGDRIAAIGNLDGASAAEEVDAAGRIVCPGFIDVHVHSELELLGGNDRYAPLRMGVTTQLAAPDGFSWAPLGKDRLREMRDYLRVFYGDRELEPDREMTIDEFLDTFRGRLPSNLVLQAPHGSIRAAVMGWAPRIAEREELAAMEKHVREWMERGARALATGLDYEPMRRADVRELTALARTAGEYGGIYVAHQRGYAAKVAAGCAETFAIGRGAGVPVHISHYPLDPEAERLIDEAAASGIDVSFDMYPYPASCTHLLLSFPEWAQAGSPEEVLERLGRRETRERLKETIEKTFPRDLLVFASVATPGPSGLEGKTLGEAHGELGGTLTDMVCDLLIESRLQLLMVQHWPAERRPVLEATFKHPRMMVGSDGIYMGLKPHPRGYGTFPRVLREYVCERKWLTMEEAIRKMSGFPAERFRIDRRGVLREGCFADIVMFDPGRIRDRATFGDPRLPPEGIERVLVNGKTVIRDGEALPVCPGRILA